MLFCCMIRVLIVITQDDEERHLKLVELNVIEQCLNLYKTGTACEQVCWV